MKRHKNHVDCGWLNKKIGNSSAAYSYSSIDGMLLVHRIYGKSRIKILWYNFILFIRYLMRIANRAHGPFASSVRIQ